jgi:hypothetical protein
MKSLKEIVSASIATLSCVGAFVAGEALAVPITYNEPPLQPGISRAGVNNQTPGNSDNPVGAEYFRFFANAGSPVTIDGDRLAGHYDMSFWVFSGIFADTNAFGPSFDSGDPGFIAFADDEQAPAIPGPFGDPFSAFNAPVTGFYTVAVTNFLSSSGPPNPFALTATGIAQVPEPGTLLLFGAGLGAFGWYRRRYQL